MTIATETPAAITTAPDVTARLTEWITAENIPGRYAPDRLAAFMLTQFGEAYVTAWLDGDTGWLRSACERYVAEADMTVREWAAEQYWHGDSKDLRP